MRKLFWQAFASFFIIMSGMILFTYVSKKLLTVLSLFITLPFNLHSWFFFLEIFSVLAFPSMIFFIFYLLFAQPKGVMQVLSIIFLTFYITNFATLHWILEFIFFIGFLILLIVRWKSRVYKIISIAGLLYSAFYLICLLIILNFAR